MAEGAAAASRLRLAGLCFFLQLLTIVLFAAFVRYGPESGPSLCSPQSNCSRRDPETGSGYPRFRDAHLQALLGFGFLLAFLGRYGPGSVATSLLIVAFAVQWALLAQGLFYFSLKGKIYVGAQSMVSADFCTAAVLISSGAVLGRVNPIQMLLMTLLEVPLFACNEFILLSLMGISDSGGSLTVHTFGAYFGLMVSRALRQPRADEQEEQQDAGRQPDVFAVLGTEDPLPVDLLAQLRLGHHGAGQCRALGSAERLLLAGSEHPGRLRPLAHPLRGGHAAGGPDPGCRPGRRGGDGDGRGDAAHPLRGPRGGVSGQPPLPAGLQVPLAHPALQAENPGHVRGPQRPRAAGGPGHLGGDAAGGAGHRRRLRRQAGARVPAGGPGQPHGRQPGVVAALRPARHPDPRRPRGQPHGCPPGKQGAEVGPGEPGGGEQGPEGGARGRRRPWGERRGAGWQHPRLTAPMPR